jgi:ectoine hydroxylase-related dioxygenase (phytanoyl-CoA dioxygenase family)
VCQHAEQYIIKPPNIHSASAFGWHYDSQYATSSGRAVAHSPYLSLWVALDDVDQENGCLVVIPGGRVDACGMCLSD